MLKTDFAVVGGGIVGLTIARELRLQHPSSTVSVFEKEADMGLHSSSRNSGVLHSGIYYPPETLKAKICRDGAREMRDYHECNKLPLRRCGKVLVATSIHDAPQVELLLDRARQNGIDAEKLDQKQLADAEPEARSVTGTAIWVPVTAVGSPGKMMVCLTDEVRRQGIQIFPNSKVVDASEKDNRLQFSNGESVVYGHMVNAAGLYADKVAKLYGLCSQYSMLPFRGSYWKLSPDSGLQINHLIYPVPDLRVPFLGVHTTTSTDGITYLGPTALPALGRENYSGLTGIDYSDLPHILGLLAAQFIRGRDGFRRLAFREGSRCWKTYFWKAAQRVLPRVQKKHLLPCAKSGIRPQLVEKKTGKLINDFQIEKTRNTTHVLNAISPAWTCSFPFARLVCNEVLRPH